MRNSTEETLREILRRSEIVRKKRERSAVQTMTGVCCLLLIGLFSVIYVLSDQTPAGTEYSVYGSFLLSAEAGGYVLVAVIAFTLGILFTLLIRRSRMRREHSEDRNK